MTNSRRKTMKKINPKQFPGLNIFWLIPFFALLLPGKAAAECVSTEPSFINISEILASHPDRDPANIAQSRLVLDWPGLASANFYSVIYSEIGPTYMLAYGINKATDDVAWETSEGCLAGNGGVSVDATLNIRYQAIKLNNIPLGSECTMRVRVDWRATIPRGKIWTWQTKRDLDGVWIPNEYGDPFIERIPITSGVKDGDSMTTVTIPAGKEKSVYFGWGIQMIWNLGVNHPNIYSSIGFDAQALTEWQAFSPVIEGHPDDICARIAVVPWLERQRPPPDEEESAGEGSEARGSEVEELITQIFQSESEENGLIFGSVLSIESGLYIDTGEVRIYDASGLEIGTATLTDGTYSYGGLATGTYFARTDSTGFLDKLWGDIPCVQDNCSVVLGTPISVTQDAVSRVAFELEGSGGLIFFDDFVLLV
jgi:hypothetical protein